MFFPEAANFLRRQLDLARRSLGQDHAVYFSVASGLAKAVVNSNMMGESGFEDRLKGLSLASRSMSWASRDDVIEVLSIVEDTNQRARRIFGPEHAQTKEAADCLKYVRARLAGEKHLLKS